MWGERVQSLIDRMSPEMDAWEIYMLETSYENFRAAGNDRTDVLCGGFAARLNNLQEAYDAARDKVEGRYPEEGEELVGVDTEGPERPSATQFDSVNVMLRRFLQQNPGVTINIMGYDLSVRNNRLVITHAGRPVEDPRQTVVQDAFRSVCAIWGTDPGLVLEVVNYLVANFPEEAANCGRTLDVESLIRHSGASINDAGNLEPGNLAQRLESMLGVRIIFNASYSAEFVPNYAVGPQAVEPLVIVEVPEVEVAEAEDIAEGEVMDFGGEITDEELCWILVGGGVQPAWALFGDQGAVRAHSDSS